MPIDDRGLTREEEVEDGEKSLLIPPLQSLEALTDPAVKVCVCVCVRARARAYVG